jgi:hypothetical protein
MNMRADFDTFAAELLNQIEAVQTLSRALATLSTAREASLISGSDKRRPAAEKGEQGSPSRPSNRPLSA